MDVSFHSSILEGLFLFEMKFLIVSEFSKMAVSLLWDILTKRIFSGKDPYDTYIEPEELLFALLSMFKIEISKKFAAFIQHNCYLFCCYLLESQTEEKEKQQS